MTSNKGHKSVTNVRKMMRNKSNLDVVDSNANTRQIRRIYIPPTKGYLRETCKSQNINPIYLTLSSPSVLFRS